MKNVLLQKKHCKCPTLIIRNTGFKFPNTMDADCQTLSHIYGNEGKGVPVQAMKVYMEKSGRAPLSLTLGTRHRRVVGDMLGTP
jgi:hypothetical protein